MKALFIRILKRKHVEIEYTHIPYIPLTKGSKSEVADTIKDDYFDSNLDYVIEDDNLDIKGYDSSHFGEV